MDGKKDENARIKNPLSVYSVASQLAFTIIVPLLLFIGGGAWFIRRFELSQWLMILFVLLGIFTMAASASAHLKKLIRIMDDGKKDENSAIKHDPKDHDY